MRAELLGVGTELLLGQIANENARWMSEQLAAIGVDVLHHQVVGDNHERIVAAFVQAMERSDVVISTGGLGPTQDDITRDALAAALGVSQDRHPEIEDLLRAKFANVARDMPRSNLIQALVPRGCRWIRPERGTAPGLAAERDGVRIYAVPGVPAEMREMMKGTILPELQALTGTVIVSRVLRATGIAESLVGEMLRDLFETSSNPTVAYLASTGEVKVRLTAKAADVAAAEALLAPVADDVASRLGDVVFSVRDEDLEAAVLRLAAERGARLATAESITGGSVAARLTSVPGSSESFLGGAVVYTAEQKERVLGVPAEMIQEHGVVSGEVVRCMAEGAVRLFRADLAVALTGAAGPASHGGVEPGRLWIGVAGRIANREVDYQREMRAHGDREQVRRWSQQAALDVLRRALTDPPLL